MSLLSQVNALLAAQRSEWPQAKIGFEALHSCLYRQFSIAGQPFTIQHNPARAVSTGARVDKASIAARKCFLCRENRAAEQQGIEFDNGNFEILVNPFPIFRNHLTIASVSHVPQAIGGHLPVMLRMAEALPGYTVFYNGPRCGASAPDHLHFQAGESDALPLWRWIDSGAGPLPVKCHILEAESVDGAVKMFAELMQSLPQPSGEQEPMINVLTRHRNGAWQIVVIPRRAHRPRCYTATHREGFMISPASVDLAGLLVVPRPDDFRRLDVRTLQTIINDVTFS